MTGNGVSRARCQRSFDLMVYAEALVILHGYEKDPLAGCTGVGEPGNWLECVPDSTEPSPTGTGIPRLLKTKTEENSN